MPTGRSVKGVQAAPHFRVTVRETETEVSVLVEGAFGFRDAQRVREALQRAATSRRTVVLDLRAAQPRDFAGAALIRDARQGIRGLPRCSVLLPSQSSLLFEVASAGGSYSARSHGCRSASSHWADRRSR